MAKLTIEGVPPLDGDYELDASSFTNRELHTIKQLSGVRAGELRAAVEAVDNDIVVAFTVIALRRAGREVHPDQIWDAPVGAITVDFSEDEEANQRPPDSPPTTGPHSKPENVGTPSDTTTPSGDHSGSVGETSQNGQSLTGGPGSERSSTFAQLTSAT